jgi:hypothetical protein
LDVRSIHEIGAIVGHSHVAIALICLAEGPVRFGQLGADMSDRAGTRFSDSQVYRAVKILFRLGYTTTEPGTARRGYYDLTEQGRLAARRLVAALASWEALR